MIVHVDRVMMIVKDDDQDDDCNVDQVKMIDNVEDPKDDCNVDQVKEKLAESEADCGRSSKSSSELENKMSRNKRGREEENLQVCEIYNRKHT